MVEGPPLLLDSYLPASMQIIAHLTDLMKYELRPGAATSTTTSTTPRPTPSHKPGVYAPNDPPGPEAYFSRTNPFQEYVQRLMNPSGDYFERYKRPEVSWTPSEGEMRSLESIFAQLGEDVRNEEVEVPEYQDLELFGDNYKDLFKKANELEEVEVNDEERVSGFLKNFDDYKFGLDLLKQKRIPPTRAYVSLLSLYDLLNKDSKKLSLNKYGVCIF